MRKKIKNIYYQLHSYFKIIYCQGQSKYMKIYLPIHQVQKQYNLASIEIEIR